MSTAKPALLYGLSLLLLLANTVSAGFGFTSPSFSYVQLSSAQTIAWNGQLGEVSLRLMLYPADAELSYMPIASNLTGSSYTWIATSLAVGSQWTLEGIDESGSVATLGTPFTIQGVESGPVSTSLLQEKPQSTPAATSTTPTETSATGIQTSTSTSTSTNKPDHKSTSTGVQVGTFIGVIVGVAVLVSIATILFLRYRNKRRLAAARDSFFGSPVGPSGTYELDNASMDTLSKPLELQGSRVEGTHNTSWGERMELGWRASRIAPGAVETSMGKRYELS